MLHGRGLEIWDLGNHSVKQGFQSLQNCQHRDGGGFFCNTGEKTINSKYLTVITVTASSWDRRWIAYLECVHDVSPAHALSNLHWVDSEFSGLQSACPHSNFSFLHLPTALFWTKVCLLSQGPSAIKAHNYHPKSIVSCCSLESRCRSAVLLSCVSLTFQLLMSLLLSIFSAEVKYTNCSVNNGGCEHFCKDDPANKRRSCNCASGYQLMNNHTTCKPVGKRMMFVVQIWWNYSNMK